MRFILDPGLGCDVEIYHDKGQAVTQYGYALLSPTFSEAGLYSLDSKGTWRQYKERGWYRVSRESLKNKVLDVVNA